jgi:aspartyl aminopeptidase
MTKWKSGYTTTEEVLDMIEQSPTAFHAAETVRRKLAENGFRELHEQEPWHLQTGGRYYVMRNHSSILSFTVPEKLHAFRIMASHSDSPCFKVKMHPDMQAEQAYIKLNVERYGGMIIRSWLDRPLSFAGRVFVRENGGLKEVLVNIDRDLLMIPSVAIHMDRKVNQGQELNLQTDMLPVLAETDGDADPGSAVRRLLAEEIRSKEEDILGADLFVYNRMKPVSWGLNREFISSGRLDDLECCFSTLLGFLDSAGSAECDDAVRMHAVFDNEEVGSGTMQGADSTFLQDVMDRIAFSCGLSRDEYLAAAASGFMLSCDNAHAVHPNHPEKADPVNRPKMNQGIVLKFDGSQKYTTDGYSGAYVRMLCEDKGIPYQVFTNRSDMPGGSTLGNISQAHVSMHTADVGLAQLSMHSAWETAGAKDPEYLRRLAETFCSMDKK